MLNILNEIKVMKALRYLLIVMSLVSVLSVKAQSTAQLPEVQMQSTSVMMSSGSTLPQAATTGAYVTGSTVGSYSPAKIHPGQPRRAGEDDGFEDEGDEPSTGNPGEPDPIGDVFWPLMLLACAYLIVRVARRRMTKG